MPSNCGIPFSLDSDVNGPRALCASNAYYGQRNNASLVPSRAQIETSANWFVSPQSGWEQCKLAAGNLAIPMENSYYLDIKLSDLPNLQSGTIRFRGASRGRTDGHVT